MKMLSPDTILKLVLPTLCASLIPAQALSNSLALTQQGIADGFTLTTFAKTTPGYTGCCSGPFGIAVASTGNVIVGTGSASSLYVFSHVSA